jgi:hypothetical protein
MESRQTIGGFQLVHRRSTEMKTKTSSAPQRPVRAPVLQGVQADGPTQDDIRQKAHAIFESRLRTGAAGDPVSDWLQAEQELRERRATARKS